MCRSNVCFLLFLTKDGGGGASPAMAESLLRMRNLDGLGKAEPRTSVDDFFEKAAEHKDSLPRMVGELYFELHRGTFTSQAQVKRLSRHCENMLVVSEILSTFAMLVRTRSGLPHEETVGQLLLRAWKLVLSSAFHDVRMHVPFGGSFTQALLIFVCLTTFSVFTVSSRYINQSRGRGIHTGFQ